VFINFVSTSTNQYLPKTLAKPMELSLIFLFILIAYFINQWLFEIKRKKRRDYYRNVYLKSEDWQRKRFVVLRRDNWRCVYCGSKASEVYHKRYAKKNIGKEPIDWLVSVCSHCHDKQHS
jgi:hypothetical protein